MIEILRRHAFSTAFLTVLFGFLFFWPENDPAIQRFGGVTMGTTYSVQVADPPEDLDPLALADDIEALLTRLDRSVFSTYASESELSRFNRHPVGEPFPASSELIDVLLLAREVAELTGGAFDVTVGPLVNLWGFGPERPPERGFVPGEAAIREALARVDYRFLSIDREAGIIGKRESVFVDLSAIAKGYAVDRLGELLERRGMESYFLEVGGELKMRGLKPDGTSWVPAIEAPEGAPSRIYEVFFSRGESLAVAGSGDYRNYFERAGVRYSHEIDPRNGRPIQHGLAAAYVIDRQTARADALATAFMILGEDEARTLADRLGQAVYLIIKQGDQPGAFSHYISPQFEIYLNE